MIDDVLFSVTMPYGFKVTCNTLYSKELIEHFDIIKSRSHLARGFEVRG